MKTSKLTEEKMAQYSYLNTVTFLILATFLILSGTLVVVFIYTTLTIGIPDMSLFWKGLPKLMEVFSNSFFSLFGELSISWYCFVLIQEIFFKTPKEIKTSKVIR